jgi:large subunit ribosomal protein L24
MKIKKGDNVVVLSGKSRGKQGKVLSVLTSKNKDLIEGVMGREYILLLQ